MYSLSVYLHLARSLAAFYLLIRRRASGAGRAPVRPRSRATSRGLRDCARPRSAGPGSPRTAPPATAGTVSSTVFARCGRTPGRAGSGDDAAPCQITRECVPAYCVQRAVARGGTPSQTHPGRGRGTVSYTLTTVQKLCKRAPHKPRIRCYRQLPCHPPLEDSTCEFGAELTPSCSILSRLKRGGSVNASYRHEDTDSRISVAPSPLTPHSVHIHANSPHRPQKTDPAPNASKMNRVTKSLVHSAFTAV